MANGTNREIRTKTIFLTEWSKSGVIPMILLLYRFTLWTRYVQVWANAAIKQNCDNPHLLLVILHLTSIKWTCRAIISSVLPPFTEFYRSIKYTVFAWISLKSARTECDITFFYLLLCFKLFPSNYLDGYSSRQTDLRIIIILYLVRLLHTSFIISMYGALTNYATGISIIM